MNGKQMLYQLRNLLQEGSTSTFLDNRTSYDYIYQAACQFAMETKILTTTATITTVADTATYDLPTNYLCLYLMNDENEYVVRYYDGTNYYFITYRDAGMMWIDNPTDGVTIPDNFAIVDTDVPDIVTGAATAAGAVTNGYTILTSSTSNFTTSAVSVGDLISNTTDTSDGVIIEVTDATHLKTALFGGTANDWTNADAFVITPQVRKQIKFNPYPDTAAHSVLVPYIEKPAPVYSDYGSYKIPAVYMPSVISYAAFLYKYRDREPNFGDAWYKQWEMLLRKANSVENTRPDRHKWRVNFKKRTYSNRSMR